MSLFEATAQRHRHATSDRALQAGNFSRPISSGDLELANRMVLSPMTRSRALEGNVPNPLAATYYAQRAVRRPDHHRGEPSEPARRRLHPHARHPLGRASRGLEEVTEAVHQAGGKIFAQLWHVGRVSHPDFHDGALPVAPSALPVEGEAFTD